MATHNAILKILISQQYLIIEYYSWYQINKLKIHSLIGQIRKFSNCMFIIINENYRNERKIAEHLRGCTYKITYISAAYYPLQLNLVQN